MSLICTMQRLILSLRPPGVKPTAFAWRGWGAYCERVELRGGALQAGWSYEVASHTVKTITRWPIGGTAAVISNIETMTKFFEVLHLRSIVSPCPTLNKFHFEGGGGVKMHFVCQSLEKRPSEERDCATQWLLTVLSPRVWQQWVPT